MWGSFACSQGDVKKDVGGPRQGKGRCGQRAEQKTGPSKVKQRWQTEQKKEVGGDGLGWHGGLGWALKSSLSRAGPSGFLLDPPGGAQSWRKRVPTAPKGAHTWHAALGLSTLHPLAALIPPVVLVHQDHVHEHPVMAGGLQPSHSK